MQTDTVGSFELPSDDYLHPQWQFIDTDKTSYAFTRNTSVTFPPTDKILHSNSYIFIGRCLFYFL